MIGYEWASYGHPVVLRADPEKREEGSRDVLEVFPHHLPMLGVQVVRGLSSANLMRHGNRQADHDNGQEGENPDHGAKHFQERLHEGHELGEKLHETQHPQQPEQPHKLQGGGVARSADDASGLQRRLHERVEDSQHHDGQIQHAPHGVLHEEAHDAPVGDAEHYLQQEGHGEDYVDGWPDAPSRMVRLGDQHHDVRAYHRADHRLEPVAVHKVQSRTEHHRVSAGGVCLDRVRRRADLADPTQRPLHPWVGLPLLLHIGAHATRPARIPRGARPCGQHHVPHPE
mmetsp:Transcript_41287/g.119425  ORF Transcript_41287/g.119425 Transcript_41287/m.119425 type:complete len:285 (+) Transcript_41287:780-1634(+)